MPRRIPLIASILVSLVFAGCAPDDESAQEEDGLTSCSNLSGTYRLAASGCSGAATAGQSSRDQTAYLPSSTPNPSNADGFLGLPTGRTLKIRQTGCSKVDLEVEVRDVEAFCDRYNAQFPASPYDRCASDLFDCETYGETCPVIDVYKKVTLSLSAGVTPGATGRSVYLDSAGLTVVDSTPASYSGNAQAPARTDSVTMKRLPSGELSFSRSGYEAESCRIAAQSGP